MDARFVIGPSKAGKAFFQKCGDAFAVLGAVRIGIGVATHQWGHRVCYVFYSCLRLPCGRKGTIWHYKSSQGLLVQARRLRRQGGNAL